MKNTTGIAIALAIIVVALGFFGKTILSFFTGSGVAPTVEQATSLATSTLPLNSASASSTSTRLSVTDNVVGTGPVAKTGDVVSILYVGEFQNGTVFDSSQLHGNKPLSFLLGAHQVIPGMEEGIVGMKVGGTRTIIVPPALGYGARGRGPIPPNATLIFKVRLVSAVSSTKK